MTIVRCPSCAGSENYHEPHCQQERDDLRAVNAQLLSELAGLATDAETFLDVADDRSERMRFRENLMNAVRVARAVIEEARK